MVSSIILMSIICLCSMNPSQMVLSVAFLTLLISSFMSLIMNFSFLAYTFILMVIGGLMIMFLYMASLMPNIQETPFLFKSLSSLLILAPSIQSVQIQTSFSEPLSLVTFPYILIFSGGYLLLTLIIMLMIVKISQGPIRGESY